GQRLGQSLDAGDRHLPHQPARLGELGHDAGPLGDLGQAVSDLARPCRCVRHRGRTVPQQARQQVVVLFGPMPADGPEKKDDARDEATPVPSATVTEPPATHPWDHDREKRIEERAAIQLRVDYKRLNTFFADYTKNISKGGTFIKTTKPLAVGTVFVFVLQLPTIDKHIELLGEVVWVTDEAEATLDKPAGMGIRF